MSYAGQQIEYALVATEYADEAIFLERYSKLTDSSIVLESFGYFIKNGLMSKEYYYPKGHKVCAKFEGNTNKIVLDHNKTKTIASDGINWIIVRFFETIIYEEKTYKIDVYSLVFVGDMSFLTKP